jgi:D-aminoacyl-tRNA deacylase
MRAVLISTEDIASMNIRDRLLEMADWEEYSEFSGLPAYRHGDFVIVQHAAPHIYAERIDRRISDFLGEEPEAIIFASKHKSESGKKALTAHPVGNYGRAEYGGKDRTLSTPSPHMMTEALRLIQANNTLPEYSVSYEVTHHGPYLETPSFFIEIGSGEEEWSDREAGKVIASAILGLKEENAGDMVAIGIGGGHYAPRLTELALRYRISFGHMAPAYALGNLDEHTLGQMVKLSGASGVYFHKMGLKRSNIGRFSEILDTLGVKRIRTSDIAEDTV